MTLTDDIDDNKGLHVVVKDGVDDAYVCGGANAQPGDWVNALLGGEVACDGANTVPGVGGTYKDCGKGARTWDDIELDVVDAKCVLNSTAIGKVSVAGSKIHICVSTKSGEACDSVEVCGFKWIACDFEGTSFRPTKSVWRVWGAVRASEGMIRSLCISSSVSPLYNMLYSNQITWHMPGSDL